MTMKKLHKLSWLLFMALFSACSHSFLEIYPENTLNEGNFYKSDVEITLLVNGCYVPMRDYEKNWHWILAELPSDNSSFQNNIRTGEPTRGVIDQFIHVSSNLAFSSFWNLSYNGITRCNKVLTEIDNPGISWSNEQLKFRGTGEALFLRALYYFNLVRQFGGVPLVLQPITAKEAMNYKRVSENDIYESVISDLKLAIENLSKASSVHENGRAGEQAALALLGKVYLTRERYGEAETVLSQVIGSGKHRLLQNYADVFNPASKDFVETLFSIQYSEASAELANTFIFNFAPHTSGGEVTNRPNINIVGAGWNQPTQDLIDSFEEGDSRKDVSIQFWVGQDWDGVVRPIPYCAKYKPPINAPDNRCGDNFPILRYSDVLLMYAEVLNEQGRSAEAVPFIQMVRDRAGLTKPISESSQGALRDLIQAERQRELCFENHRWYDLKRTGKAVEVMTAHGARERAAKPFLYPEAYLQIEKKLLAPIPANEILINQLEQNPGY